MTESLIISPTIERDPYYSRTEVSNSDLTWLKKLYCSKEERYDIEAAYRFGTLLDVMVTEVHKLNIYKRIIAGQEWIYSKDEMKLARAMEKSFYRDKFCADLVKQCSFQKISVKAAHWIDYGNLRFCLPVRCKWDLFIEAYDMSGDIKTTTAKTQKEFEEAAKYFDYDRQRAWYMDIEGRNNDVLIGISKKNLKVFKIFIDRGGDWYNAGLQKYQELGFKYWTMFGDPSLIQRAA